jgi:hypothetical protein
MKNALPVDDDVTRMSMIVAMSDASAAVVADWSDDCDVPMVAAATKSAKSVAVCNVLQSNSLDCER